MRAVNVLGVWRYLINIPIFLTLLVLQLTRKKFPEDPR